MKRLLLSLALLFAAGAAHAGVTISTAAAAHAGAFPTVLQLAPNESLTYIASGTFTGRVELQKSRNGTNYEPVGISTTNNAGGVFTGTFSNDKHAASYRWFASTWTAGSFGLSLADNDDLVSKIDNLKGVPTVSFYDDSVAFSVRQSTAPRSATVGVRPVRAGELVLNTTDMELCLSTGVTVNTWVKVSTPSAACSN